MVKLKKQLFLSFLKLKNVVIRNETRLIYFTKNNISTIAKKENIYNKIGEIEEIKKENKTKYLKINDFFYFNIYLMNDRDFVNFVLTYNFLENKNIYVCILLHLSRIFKNLTLNEIIKILEKVIEKNKSAFSHLYIKGENISNLYTHLCNHIIKLNNLELITVLKCFCYTVNEYPSEHIKIINYFILSKKLHNLDLNLLHDICNCLIKIKNDFRIRKLDYDESLHLKISTYLKNQILNVDFQNFFQILHMYINMTKHIEDVEKYKNINLLNKPNALNDLEIMKGDFNTKEKETVNNENSIEINEKNIQNENDLNEVNKTHSLEEYSDNFSEGKFLYNNEINNLKNNCKLILLNKINEINKENVLSSINIFKWLNIKDSYLFTHICEIFFKYILYYNTKYVVRFLRKCHSLKFEKGLKNKKDEEKKFIKFYKDEQEIEEKKKRMNQLKRLDNNNEKAYDDKVNELNNNLDQIEGSNLFLHLLNEKLYKMNIEELKSITYSLYVFVENMKQFSHLNNLKNNMNLLFSMTVQYISNFIDKENLYNNNCNLSKNNFISDLYYDQDKELKTNYYDINMNIDYIYISPKDIYINKFDENYYCDKNIKLVCDILLNISYFNVSKNHKKIKFIYEYINNIIDKRNKAIDINNLLNILMILSNFYLKTNDNYIFHNYKKILELLEYKKNEINGHHFNKIAVAISPILNEENKLIHKYSEFLIFFVENNIVPLRSCVFLLQNIMKSLNIRLNEQLILLKLSIINRINAFLTESINYIQTMHDDDDLIQNHLKKFMLLHSINENTLICVIASLSLILQSSKYGTNIKNDTIILIQKMVKYVSKNSFQRFPKKHIYSELLEVLSSEYDDIKQILLKKI
ncbi:conserved Plasmodium protein, unknown function [Plasmodium relictum]|uniref:Uncharacterized protein n=1 Tax=Plasmodium relictum TaxID=85471 RepID=A0A1J1H0R8_PLARL|nr:conserved Plasmodium protein, unknown function [Plasmodium relictum]CRG98442.1 conserved Plasmodium protein, unknown function [Plasmodium relictum]